MANSTVNAQILGQATGTNAQGQVNSQGGISGFQSRNLYLIGTSTLDGATGTITFNWIDGTQKLFQRTLVINALNITAPATINGVANQAVISGVGSFGSLVVGQSVVVAGFTNSGNNGTFTINAVTSSTITVTNASSVAETNNPSATVTANLGSSVLSARASRATKSIAGVADTAASSIAVTNVNTISDTGCVVAISANGTSTNTLTVLVEVIPAS